MKSLSRSSSLKLSSIDIIWNQEPSTAYLSSMSKRYATFSFATQILSWILYLSSHFKRLLLKIKKCSMSFSLTLLCFNDARKSVLQMSKWTVYQHQWKTSLIFINSVDKHRVTFSAENFVSLHTDQLTRLNVVLLHYSFSDKCWIFVNVTLIINSLCNDWILYHSLLYLFKDQMIMSLSVIKAKKIYVLSVMKSLSADDSASSLQINDEHLLLHVNMNIEFLWESESEWER